MNGLPHEVPSGDGILTLGVLEGLLYTSLRNLRRYFESEVPAVFMRGVLGCTPRHDHYRIRRCGSCEWRERWVGCVVWRLLDQAGTIMIFGIANVSMKHDVAACLQIRC